MISASDKKKSISIQRNSDVNDGIKSGVKQASKGTGINKPSKAAEVTPTQSRQKIQIVHSSLSPPPNLSTASAQSVAKAAEKDPLELEVIPEKTSTSKFKCHVCNVECSAQWSWNMHINGSEHKKLLAADILKLKQPLQTLAQTSK